MYLEWVQSLKHAGYLRCVMDWAKRFICLSAIFSPASNFEKAILSIYFGPAVQSHQMSTLREIKIRPEPQLQIKYCKVSFALFLQCLCMCACIVCGCGMTSRAP